VLRFTGQNNKRTPNFNELGARLFPEDIFCKITIPEPQICYGNPKCRTISVMIILDSNGIPINRTVVFDVETTGLSPEQGDRVIEIGALALDGETIVDEFHSFIDSDQPIHPSAQKIHGITREMLKGQPKAEEVMPRFRVFLENSILVAHYADFDLSFVGSEFRRLGINFRQPYYCTLALGRKMFPELDRYDLRSLYKHLYSSELEIRHRALEDARITAKFGSSLINKKPLIRHYTDNTSWRILHSIVSGLKSCS
jgi:DNA polymerase III subunit epsilon